MQPRPPPRIHKTMKRRNFNVIGLLCFLPFAATAALWMVSLTSSQTICRSVFDHNYYVSHRRILTIAWNSGRLQLKYNRSDPYLQFLPPNEHLTAYWWRVPYSDEVGDFHWWNTGTRTNSDAVES